MTLYLAIKYLHVVSSVALVGIGFGSAYYMFFANRSGSAAAQAVVARLVTREFVAMLIVFLLMVVKPTLWS